MTDCSSIQGSTSSSSDAMSSRSDGGGSSCINTSSRIRVIRMIRPNSRRIVLGPENISIGFGFAVRGGKEFGTGFFVSRIEKGGEADSKGLRVGDQIIRVNGYNVEDAVHKELTQFISSQDRLTLKVRGVGMLPIKEKTLDTLTWHIVPRHALTTTLAALDEHMTIKDIRIILNVEPKTKLGLGICKGPEWKPGIFVQFTKDFSVARESGLRPGDQILSCNSIDFSDVLFSEAVAVMKSSQTLEMIVRTGAGLDLFPGESSGYNSSASSVTGDQSPCWGDQSAKRLSMVREESISKQWNENCNSTNLDRRKNFHKNLTRPTINNNNLNQCITTTNDLPPNNKTIIQLSETGTLINNTLITNPNNNLKSENLIIRPNQQPHHHPQHLSMNFITPDYNVAALSLNEGGGCTGSNSNNTNDQTNENNIGKMNGKIADICFVSRQSETKTVIVEVHRSAADENKKNNNNGNTNDMNTNAVVNVARRSTNTTNNIPPKPPILPSLSLSSNTSTSSSSPSPSSSLTDGLNDRSPSVASSIISSGGTSLCSAISEELKKRKERLSQCSNQTNNENNNNENETIINAANSRLQPKRGGCVSVLGGNDDFRHNALMDEFKRAHRKMFKNGFQETEEERQEELRKTSMMCDETDHRSTPHQQQTLPLNYNNNNNNDIINKNHNQINHNNNKNHSNGHQNGFTKTELIQNNVMNNNGQFPTPPPPPQFSNNPPMIKISDDDDYTEPIIIPPPPPPETPIPDYDSTPVNSMRKQPQQQNYHANGYVRVATTTTTSANVGTIGRVASTETAKANGDIGELESIDSFKLQNPSSPQPKPPSAYFVAQSSGPPTMKKSIRPVSVTIGEYGGGAVGYRKEPSKFDFIAKSNESSPTSSLPSPTTPTNNSIKDDSGNVSHMLRSELEMTLSRSNLKKRNNEFDRNSGVINHIQNGGVHQNGSNGITQNGGGIQQIQNGGNKIQNGNCNYQKYQNDIGQNGGSKSVLHKTQSSNIEKLTNMLQNKQHIFEQNNNDRSATLTNSNRVTINIPNNKTTITTSTGKIELRKTESTPTNGILKNGLNRTSYIDKSISFGN